MAGAHPEEGQPLARSDERPAGTGDRPEDRPEDGAADAGRARSRRTPVVVAVCAAAVVAAAGAGLPVARAVSRHAAELVASDVATGSGAPSSSPPTAVSTSSSTGATSGSRSSTAATSTNASTVVAGTPTAARAARSGRSSAAATTASGIYSGIPVGTAVAYAIPDLVTSLAAVPAPSRGAWQLQDLGQYRLQPVVPGQACSSRNPFNIAGRQWSWYREGWASVDVSVTGWRTGRGSAAFDDVVQNAGTCRFTDAQQVVSVKVPGAAQAWVATSSLGGTSAAEGAARVGDVVIGVQITDAGDGGTGEVSRLLQAISAEMVADHLPAAART